MENASKALLMAAGILVGLIIVSLFIYETKSMSITARSYEEKMARTQILEFNSKFESYAYGSKGRGEYQELKAQDIVTLYNYVLEWNYGGELNEGHPSDIIEIEFRDNSRENIKLGDVLIRNYRIEENDVNGPQKKLPVEELLANYSGEKYYFNCTNLEYREPDGRICSLTILCNKK